MANAVVSSGLVTKQCVDGLPSLRAAKLRLYDVTIELASPADTIWLSVALLKNGCTSAEQTGTPSQNYWMRHMAGNSR